MIVATWHPNETVVLKTIRDLGLEHQVIFNKGAVMVLPSGINKAAGLGAALEQLGLSPHNVVGIGDAENDHAFMSMCECSVAVANALPMVQERADYVTRGDHGAGVVELIDMIVADDLAELEPRLARHHLLLGTRVGQDEQEVRVATVRRQPAAHRLVGRRQIDTRHRDSGAPGRAGLSVLHHRSRGRLRCVRGRGGAGRPQPRPERRRGHRAA